MAFDINPYDSMRFSQRIWRLSGFLDGGELISHEFSGPDSGADTYPFFDVCIIGRDTERCNFVIPHPKVSRVHAELKYFPDKAIGIRDLGSTNGTFVDDMRIGSEYHILSIGSRGKFGEVGLTISYPR